MPLSEKARIEVYIPDLPTESYQNLIDAFEQEFTYSFGGCSIIHNIDGNYLSSLGFHVRGRVNLVYSDMPIGFENNMVAISQYTDEVRQAAYEGLQEESVLVVCFKVFHSSNLRGRATRCTGQRLRLCKRTPLAISASKSLPVSY